MINNVHICICLIAILLSSLGKNLFNYLVTFIELLVFLLFYLKIACYILSTCPLRCVLQIYQSVACFFITFIVLKNQQQVLAFSSVQFSGSVMSSSLWSHELQHPRPPCPSPSPRVHSNSRPSSWWCHPAISFCHPLFLLTPIPPSIRVLSNESTLHMILALVRPNLSSFCFLQGVAI